jgi:hypothetical protein
MNDATRKAMAHIHGNYPRLPQETNEDVVAREAITGVMVPDLALGQVPSPGPEATRHASHVASMLEYRQAIASLQYAVQIEAVHHRDNHAEKPTEDRAEIERLRADKDDLNKEVAMLRRHLEFYGLPSPVAYQAAPTSDGDIPSGIKLYPAAVEKIRGYDAPAVLAADGAVYDPAPAYGPSDAFMEMLKFEDDAREMREGDGVGLKFHDNELHWDEGSGRWVLAMDFAGEPSPIAATATEDAPSPRDRVGPDDEPHRRVHEVIGDILVGKVTSPARKALGDALDKANAPPPARDEKGAHRPPDSKAFRLGGPMAIGFYVR